MVHWADEHFKKWRYQKYDKRSLPMPMLRKDALTSTAAFSEVVSHFMSVLLCSTLNVGSTA